MKLRAANLDIYRKVPHDLVEGTRSGSLLSIICLLVMLTLFFYETRDFLRRDIETKMCLDSDKDGATAFRINLNITMMDLKCEFATIDVVSVWGEEQNVTQNVKKYPVDGYGVRQRLHSRNKNQRDVLLKDDSVIHRDIEELIKEGAAAVSLTPDSFKDALKENKFVFVDYYAMWCIHCRMLMPTWEAFAELMVEVVASHLQNSLESSTFTESEKDQIDGLKLPVLIAKFDCVEYKEFCRDQRIYSYPTLQLFIDGEKYHSEYWEDRTLPAFTKYLANVEDEYFNNSESTFDNAHRIATENVKQKGIEYEHILDRVKKK